MVCGAVHFGATKSNYHPGQPGASRPGQRNGPSQALKDPGEVGGSDAGRCPGGRRCSCDGQSEEGSDGLRCCYGRKIVGWQLATQMRAELVLDELEIAPSVGSKGDAYDNAIAEPWVATFKSEFVDRRGRRSESRLQDGRPSREQDQFRRTLGAMLGFVS
jgi:hypothetical protein